jgi:hypothetical protein
MKNYERIVRRLNDRLGADLGRNPKGQPLYRWMYSEDEALLHPMRVPGEYDFKADPETGIILAHPVYKLRKLCVNLDKQWVLCHWMPSPSEDEWRRQFGYWLEWPKGGMYYPTNVDLDPGVVPCERINLAAITSIRQHRLKSPVDAAIEARDAINERERKEKADLFDEIRNDCTTYDHVPGRKDSVNYPTGLVHN